MAEHIDPSKIPGILDRLRDFADSHHDEFESRSGDIDPGEAARPLRVISTALYLTLGQDHTHLLADDADIAEAQRLISGT
jgi:hypothetical protein